METISLASGASYFVTPEPVKQAAINAIHQNHTFYGPVEGLASLRQAIAEGYSEQTNQKFTADQVLITPGTKLALHTIFSVLLQDGDEVLVPAPGWFGFNELLKYSKGNLAMLHTSPADDFVLKPEALRKAINPKTRILLLSNPNNPTGTVYSHEQLQEFVQVLLDYPKVYLVADEIYDQVLFDQKFTSMVSFPEIRNRLLVVNGFSKSFAMSGWRVGFMLSSPELIAKCLDFQHATVSGVNPINQEAALAAWQNRNSLYEPYLAKLNENRAQIMAFFKGLNIHFPEPQGAYYLFPDLTDYVKKCCPENQKLSSVKFAEKLKAEAGVEVVPGDSFGVPGFARLSFAVEPDTLTEALSRIEKFLKSL